MNKKAFFGIMVGILAILMVQAAFALSYDRQTTFNTRHGDLTIVKHVDETWNSRQAKSNVYRNGEYIGQFTRNAQWYTFEENGHTCHARNVDVTTSNANGNSNSYSRYDDWCRH